MVSARGGAGQGPPMVPTLTEKAEAMASRQASSSAVLMVPGAAGRGRGWCRAWGTPQLCPKRQRGHWHLHFPCPANPFLKTRGTAWRSCVPMNGVSGAGPYPASPPSPAGCCCHPGWKAANPYPQAISYSHTTAENTPCPPSAPQNTLNPCNPKQKKLTLCSTRGSQRVSRH